ncbi:hypothetical protein L6267_00900 [Candidatus Parcubacteria bacterium]|nr:hypothetical protein [Candidatus Parcubacteria bacterium]
MAKDPPEVTRNKIQDTRYKQITNSKSQITNKSQIPNSKFYNYKDVSSSAAPQSLAEDCGGNSQTVWQKAIDFVKDSGRKALARSMRWLHCSRRSGTVEPECKTLKNNNGLQNGSTALRDYGADSEVGGGFSGADRAEKVSYNTDVVNLEDGKKKYQIHVGHINYKDDETEEFEKIDTTLLPSAYGWEMDKASYHLEIPEYADDWFKFVNDFEEFDNQKTTPEKEMALGGPENIISSGSTSQQDADNNIVADENENYKNVFYQECGAESNQKTISNEMAPGSLTDLPICAPDKLINSIAYQNNLSSVSYMDVEIGGIEPPKRSLSDTRGKPAIHTSNLLYQKNSNQEIAAIFAPTQSPKRDCGGHASKPPQSSARDCGEAGCETVAMRPIGVSHTKGELIENDEWNKKKVLYKNAFGNNIDLEVAAKNIGFDKLVVINEKPKDLSQDLEFSFEIGLDGFEVYTSPPTPLLNRRGEIGEEDGLEAWNQEEPLVTSQRIILNKLKQTWFREFSVWDSAGNRGKIRVRIEKVDDDNQKTTPEKEMASGASAGASTELVNYNCSIADENNLSSIYKYCGLQASNASHMDVEMPGIEPGKHELTSSASQPAIPTSNLLYQNKNHGTNNYKYIFTKILDKEFLENAVYPVYTDDITSYYAGAGDGYVSNLSTSWDTAHDAIDGDGAFPASTPFFCRTYYGYYRTFYRTFFPVDTSAIADSDTITAAELNIYVTVKQDDVPEAASWVNVVQTTQADPTTLITEDYDQCGAIDNPTEGATRITIANITTSAYNTWTLNATGRGWIDKTGWTKLGIREGHDATDTQPVNAGTTYKVDGSTSEQTGTSQDPYLEVTTAPKSDVPYALSTVGGGQFLIMNSGTTYTATSTTDINDSQWHHIVGSYDGTTMKIYIDGTLEDTNTDFSGNLPTNDGNVRIGADYQSTPDNFFSGLIDEARIYNRALSADEVGELYRVGARRFQAN